MQRFQLGIWDNIGVLVSRKGDRTASHRILALLPLSVALDFATVPLPVQSPSQTRSRAVHSSSACGYPWWLVSKSVRVRPMQGLNGRQALYYIINHHGVEGSVSRKAHEMVADSVRFHPKKNTKQTNPTKIYYMCSASSLVCTRFALALLGNHAGEHRMLGFRSKSLRSLSNIWVPGAPTMLGRYISSAQRSCMRHKLFLSQLNQYQ
ncbi:hypothetical protein BDY19DRAFT_197409 [Irpex rosettiformis]|uniref:Uncharacterized protein n=1 Tax=Irpex rosettiformis TaxID=378272 RepID=A0ACB8U2M3_9APHY|nr:hypothetical protein BDY19DRAFT_197409 [Irpex rosettiformis]